MKLQVVSQNNCRGCKELVMYLDNEYPELDYDYVNLDKLSPEDKGTFIAENYVMSTPITIVREDEEEVFRITGFQSGATQEIDLAIEQLT